MRTRRGRCLVLVALLSLSITCSGLDNIDVAATGETTIQGSPLGGLLGTLSFLGFDGIDISQSQTFRNQGYTKEQIDSVRLKSFSLTVTAPVTGTFDFLSTVSFFAEAANLPAVEIARLNPVPGAANRVEMEILDVELRDYAVAESMTITTSATGVTPEEDTTVSANVVLDIDVDVGGAVGCRVVASRSVRPAGSISARQQGWVGSSW